MECRNDIENSVKEKIINQILSQLFFAIPVFKTNGKYRKNFMITKSQIFSLKMSLICSLVTH